MSATTPSDFFKSVEGIAIATFLPVITSINTAIQSNPANASLQNILGGEGVSWLAQLQAAVPNLQEAEAQFVIGYLVSQAQTWAASQSAASQPATPVSAPPATPAA
jgi:septal ring-binding cell division protein DamX